MRSSLSSTYSSDDDAAISSSIVGESLVSVTSGLTETTNSSLPQVLEAERARESLRFSGSFALLTEHFMEVSINDEKINATIRLNS